MSFVYLLLAALCYVAQTACSTACRKAQDSEIPRWAAYIAVFCYPPSLAGAAYFALKAVGLEVNP